MMKNSVKTLFAASALFALQACAPAPTASNLAPVASSPVSGAVSVEDLSFPLPAGQWREVYTHKVPGQSPRAPQVFKLYASVSNGVIDRAAVFWVQRKTSFVNKWRQYQSCLSSSENDVHHSEVALNEGGAQPTTNPQLDCWHVRTLSMGRSGGAHPVIEALHLFAEREGLVAPAAMIGARFAQKRRTDSRDYAEYLWNPDILAPNPDGIWTPRDWTSDAVAASPAKTIVVERITRWGQEWRARLKPGGTS